MQIVVLDGYTLNPGDLSWEGFEELGDLIVYDRTPNEKVIERAENAEIVITNKTVLDRDTILKLSRLKYIGLLATGYNVVDIEAAHERGIPVTNVPTYGTKSVAQMVFAHLLELTLNVGHHSETVKEGKWSSSPDFCYWDKPLIELEGLTMGIIGFGKIGRATGELAHAFGMNVIAYDKFPTKSPPEWVKLVDLETVFRESDVISLHVPLTDDNHHFVNKEKINLMKPSAFIINTSRGPLINEADLADALNSGRIAGAGLDVLSTEPPPNNNPLLNAANCLITPHIAWATKSVRRRLMNCAVENLKSFLEGNPQNIVN